VNDSADSDWKLRVLAEYNKLVQAPLVKPEQEHLPAAGSLTCPSLQVSLKGKIFGFRKTTDVKFQFLETPIAVSRRASVALATRSFQERVRIAGPCVTSACGNWSESGCRLGHAVAAAAGGPPEGQQNCAIRSSCRWFAERGSQVCRGCSFLSF